LRRVQNSDAVRALRLTLQSESPLVEIAPVAVERLAREYEVDCLNHLSTNICQWDAVLTSFLNPWMLAGLAGIALPIIAHLLSRKQYDQVDWAAMQFLELDVSAKRSIRLEELLLLVLRIGLISLVALALARPWISGRWLGGIVSTQSRDVVLVMDGSYSMAWEGKAITPQTASQQLARQFLKDLLPGDSVQVIDTRELPHVMLPEMTRDTYRVRQALDDLPLPAGSSDLAGAVNRATQLLAAGTNLQREVVVFTDMQSLGWKSDDDTFWLRYDDIRSQSPIVPRVWVIDTSSGDLGKAANFSVERIQLSRELAVTGVPVKIASKVRYTGGDAPIVRKVSLEVDQQRLEDQTVNLKLQPQGETSVDFEYRFETPGSHLISLVLENDALPGDNRADAVVTVTESLPILMIDGDQKRDPTRCETYFATAALSTAGELHPWIKPTIITPEQVGRDHLKGMEIAIVANVMSLSSDAVTLLQEFAASGHTVLFTLGDHVDKDRYTTMLVRDGPEMWPCELDAVATEDGHEKRGVRVATGSLELPWLRPFRADQGGTLIEARWSKWWKVKLTQRQANTPARELPFETGGATEQGHKSEPLTVGNPLVEMRLSTGDPLLVTQRFGRGTVAVFTSSLDADWNTLPAKLDYVPFLHELLFSLATPTGSRNLDVGTPLVLNAPTDFKIDDYQFLNPANKPVLAEKIDDAFQSTVRLRTTTLPGVYRFVRKTPKPNEPNRTEYFAVNFDRSESDLTQLTDAQRQVLSGNQRIQFVADLPALRQNMFTEDTRAEIWWGLLYAFLLGLAIETWMTRRMVNGGYANQEPQ